MSEANDKGVFAMFGKMMNSYYYGKSGKGDFQKEDLPHNRWQLFWAMLRVRFASLSRMNLMVLPVFIPLMGVLLVNGLRGMQVLNLAVGFQQSIEQGTELGEEYTEEIIAMFQTAPYYADGVFNLAAFGRDILQSILMHVMIWLIPCILITGPVEAGIAYVLRNWARDEHAFIWSDFKDAVKDNWKQGLGISAITSVMPVIVYISWQFYGSMAEKSVFYLVPQMLIIILGVLWSLALIFAYPLMVTYQMSFTQLIKNSIVLGIGRLPQSVGIRLLTLVPMALCLALFLFTGVGMYGLLILGGYYILIGLTLHRFIYASFSNAVFDRFINSRLEGVRVNRGLAEDDEEYEDEEEEHEAGETAEPARDQEEN